MTNFIKRRLQIFVSSTYTDLIPERQAAVEAILSAGHIPAGMELFTAGDESQLDVIKQWIDESDVYLLILGGRYGSIEPKTQKSYTHLEYEYALEIKKPLFACTVTDSAQEERIKARGSVVLETENPQDLKKFRALVMTKIIRPWEDIKDIKIAIHETLGTFARRDDLIGWIRADQEANMPALTDEMTRLSKENAELRRENENLHGKDKESFNGLDFDELTAALENKQVLQFFTVHREALGGHRGLPIVTGNMEEIQKLTVLGLVTKQKGQAHLYTLTDSGISYLNRYEMLKLKANSIS